MAASALMVYAQLAVPAASAALPGGPAAAPASSPVLYMPSPSPHTPPSMTAQWVAPKPLDSPGSWITERDYPRDAKRARVEGLTGFWLSVDTTGTVTNCVITKSSGWPSIDTATCTGISQRARFAPARDGYGHAIGGSFNNRAMWRLVR